MENIKLNIDNAFSCESVFVSKQAVNAYDQKVKECMEMLHKGTGKGNDFLGWLTLPSSITDKFMDEVIAVADDLRKNCDVVVVAGIGGSYLGAKAVNEALLDSFAQLKHEGPQVVYAGQNIGEDYLYELQELLRNKRFGIICISKSGTTTEPALAFRLLKTQLEEQAGKEKARELIVCITDKSRGALRTLATQEGYKTFVIEDNIGGRFSVLSPVGLLPVACAGFDIEQLIAGSEEEQVSVVGGQRGRCQHAVEGDVGVRGLVCGRGGCDGHACEGRVHLIRGGLNQVGLAGGKGGDLLEVQIQHIAVKGRAGELLQIGRASCRERV